MTTDIIMPNLGFDSQENRLVEWLKQPGEMVQKGEPIAIVESDKSNVELESIAGGILLEQLCQADEIVRIGAVIARIGQAGEVVPPENLSAPPRPSPSPEKPNEPARSDNIQRNSALDPADGVRALPKVRKAAREAGIALAAVTASGPHGSITLTDLQAYQAALTSSSSALQDVHEIPLSKTRQTIGRRLSDSKREAPHFYVTGEFDLEQALRRLKAMPPPQPGLNDLVQYLAVQSLRHVPELNATYEEGRLYRYQGINLAVAVAHDEGLLTPVIAGAEHYSLMELASVSQPLIQRAQANRLQADDLRPGTFTISNLGVIRQVDQFTAVINPPQVAILAVGAIKPRPVVIDGGLHVRHTVYLTLSGDHRVVDGMHLGRFMAAFQEQLDRFNQEG